MSQWWLGGAEQFRLLSDNMPYLFLVYILYIPDSWFSMFPIGPSDYNTKGVMHFAGCCHLATYIMWLAGVQHQVVLTTWNGKEVGVPVSSSLYELCEWAFLRPSMDVFSILPLEKVKKRVIVSNLWDLTMGWRDNSVHCTYVSLKYLLAETMQLLEVQRGSLTKFILTYLNVTTAVILS